MLLACSIATTMANGARFQQNFLEGMPPVVRDADLWPWPWLFANPELWFIGWSFSCALLGILLVHEFGHYVACRLHKVKITLPMVIPAPTLSGTVGAVIRMDSRIPSRDAIFDIGFYGPLLGFIASCLVIALGFALSFDAPANPVHALVRFGGDPLAIRIIHKLMMWHDPRTPSFDNIAPHPVLVAGWIGMFITAVNLVPAGQLDGGHILYAFSPRLHRKMTILLPFVLFIAGTLFWVGWILWGILLLLPTMRHPRVTDDSTPKTARRLLALVAFGIFLLSLSLTPFYDNSLMHLLHLEQ